jgi:hypothetical protein
MGSRQGLNPERQLGTRAQTTTVSAGVQFVDWGDAGEVVNTLTECCGLFARQGQHGRSNVQSTRDGRRDMCDA